MRLGVERILAPDPLLPKQVLLLGLVSFLVGVLGGFVGLALGTMRLPALLLLGLPPAPAAGTNILVSTLSALVRGYRQILEKLVNWPIVAWMGIPAVVGSFIGEFLARPLLPKVCLYS